MKLFAAPIVAAVAVVSAAAGATFGAVVTHPDTIAVVVCEAPVLPRAPIVDRYCPKPGFAYLEGSAPFVRITP